MTIAEVSRKYHMTADTLRYYERIGLIPPVPRGKSGASDAGAEVVAYVRRLLDDQGVLWQMAELGKVDVGGGGTIAYILALYGMNVIDSGVPVLNMHAPWEIISKVDLFEALQGYEAFLKEA